MYVTLRGSAPYQSPDIYLYSNPKQNVYLDPVQPAQVQQQESGPSMWDRALWLLGNVATFLVILNVAVNARRARKMLG